MILLDVEKAYDLVWQDAVVYMLFRSNPQPFLVKIIEWFLTNRSFTVTERFYKRFRTATLVNRLRWSKNSVSSLGNSAAPLATDRKMTLLDYQNSPFVSKMKPRCLSFLDFNVVISQEDFEQIPKYMRGRESVDELVTFLQTVVVACFEEKYTLLYKNKKAITNQQDLALWKAFNLQQAAFPIHKFVTQGTSPGRWDGWIDKKVNGKIQMLRHLHIMQETRHEGTVYYFWIRE
ncbi:hypothetical protein quinque_002750 [Culex quinquefasciatus]